MMFAPGDAGDPIHLAPIQPEESKTWWHAAAMNLLHAGNALNSLDPAGRRQTALREAAGTLGWTEPLKLTEAAARKVRAAQEDRN